VDPTLFDRGRRRRGRETAAASPDVGVW